MFLDFLQGTKRKDRRRDEKETSKNEQAYGFVVVVLVFYGPSTHFRSFQARSVFLSTLFLGKPPRQFTST